MSVLDGLVLKIISSSLELQMGRSNIFSDHLDECNITVESAMHFGALLLSTVY
jgi:hypothetical protein